MPPLKSYSPQNEYNGNNNSPTDNTNSGASGGGSDTTTASSSSNVPTSLNIQRSTTKSPPYCNGQYPFKVLANLQQLRSQKRFCDVDIVAGNDL